MSTITCDKCGDPIVVEGARTIVLPFTCLACESAIEKFTQETAGPTSAPLTDEQVEVAKFYEAMSPASENQTLPEPTEEFATVENTTLLIKDLETQLAVAKQRGDELLDRVGQHEKEADNANEQITYLNSELLAATNKIQNLQDKNDAQRGIIETLTNYGIAREKTVDMQAAKIRVLQGQVDAYEKDAVALSKEIIDFTRIAFARKDRDALTIRALKSGLNALHTRVGELSRDLAETTKKRDFWISQARYVEGQLEEAQMSVYQKVKRFVNDTF